MHGVAFASQAIVSVSIYEYTRICLKDNPAMFWDADFLVRPILRDRSSKGNSQTDLDRSEFEGAIALTLASPKVNLPPLCGRATKHGSTHALVLHLHPLAELEKGNCPRRCA